MQNTTHGKINKKKIFSSINNNKNICWGDFWKNVGVKGPGLCIALSQGWEERRRMAEEGKEGAGQHCHPTMGSLSYKGYRHSEVSSCLSI